MSGHDEVERALRADAASLTPPGPSIDVAAAARGARARRMPVQIAVGTASVLALIGFGGIAFASLPQLGGQVSASDSAAESPEIGPLAPPESAPTNEELDGGDGEAGGEQGGEASPEGGAPPDGDTAWSLFRCGGELPPAGYGADLGLTLEVLPLDAADARDGRLPVTVTLTNRTDALITGNSAIWPHLALALDNSVVWHTAGGMDAVAIVIDLAPGESLRYETHLDLLVCDGPAGDDPFPSDLPAAPPGDYEVVAALDVTAPGTLAGPVGTELVISPRASLTIP